ncbi:DgyrCDS3775 [Dimorphilus gyrociliatus]|uniref:DgyrCDS3775 n=1 Tax=Dimorphilus gyrociliatus TaxID=2664684 RepID=A0A7I8VEP2_9ANNE|nr:DgyrCDS3775 [Dimorphilus gyrociliatus]
MASAGSGEVIDINMLNIQQVESILQSLNNEVDFFTSSMVKLKEAYDKLNSSLGNVERLKTMKGGMEMLVPVTSAMYVDGEIADTKKVIVELGTGYFVEKSIPEAEKFFKRKLDFLKKEIEKIDVVRNQKLEQKQITTNVFKKKLIEHQSQMAAAKS